MSRCRLGAGEFREARMSVKIVAHAAEEGGRGAGAAGLRQPWRSDG
jgi:hypothetical protein